MKSVKYLFAGFILILFSSGLYAQKSKPVNLGAAFGGSGLAGALVQYQALDKFAFEFGLYNRLVYIDVFEPRWTSGLAMDANLSLVYRKDFRAKSGRLRSDGIYLKAAKGLKDLEENMAGIGWFREFYSDNHPNSFWQLQIGPSFIQRTETYLNTRYPPGFQEQSETLELLMIYVRMSWFFSII
jgi:hypothetical protein